MFQNISLWKEILKVKHSIDNSNKNRIFLTREYTFVASKKMINTFNFDEVDDNQS